MRHPAAPLSIGLSVALAAGLLIISLLVLPSVPAQSREPDKTLKLFFSHTGERAEFTFKHNGRYDRAELEKINRFLRDWRKNEPTHMDPQLLDLVWAIYQESGSKDYIHVVSAYRSPATNEMLRKRSSGVAKNSQHRLGKAMDWFVTDVPLSKLRAIAMKMQGGGVGYYPRSGSPFIHTDTGNVRAWPRMTREQLIALFPNGNTLHIPADGKPLPGYEQALARRNTTGTTALAYLETEPSPADAADRTGTDANTRSWLSRVFPGSASNEEDVAEEAPAPAPAESPATVAAADEGGGADVRMPRARPSIATDGASAPTLMASADTAALSSMLVMPASATLSPEALGIGAESKPTVAAEDAIATLIAPETTASPVAPASPELAYAPALAASDADRAILAAFDAVDASDAVKEADPTLVAALTGGVVAGDEETVDAASAVVVAAADLPTYEGDEDALLDLIDAQTPADPRVANLAMPEPQKVSELFVAPQAASSVTSLHAEAGPPIDGFRPKQENHDDQGFFAKLFASLIE